MKWTGPNAGANFSEYGKLSDALALAARARSRLGVVLLDGKVSAIVAPPDRTRASSGYEHLYLI